MREVRTKSFRCRKCPIVIPVASVVLRYTFKVKQGLSDIKKDTLLIPTSCVVLESIWQSFTINKKHLEKYKSNIYSTKSGEK